MQDSNEQEKEEWYDPIVQILNRVAKVFWGAFKESPAGFFAPLVAFWRAAKNNATPQRHYDDGRRSHGVRN